jgi:hypothetical protein
MEVAEFSRTAKPPMLRDSPRERTRGASAGGQNHPELRNIMPVYLVSLDSTARETGRLTRGLAIVRQRQEPDIRSAGSPHMTRRQRENP